MDVNQNASVAVDRSTNNQVAVVCRDETETIKLGDTIQLLIGSLSQPNRKKSRWQSAQYVRNRLLCGFVRLLALCFLSKLCHRQRQWPVTKRHTARLLCTTWDALLQDHFCCVLRKCAGSFIAYCANFTKWSIRFRE